MEGHEEGNYRFCFQILNLSVEEGRAPKARKKDRAPSDSCMEVG